MDLLIVRFLAPHVCHTVDEKGNVESDREPHIEIYPKGVPQGFVPVVNWNSHGEKDVKNGE